MVEYNGVLMELVNIDHFERNAVSSSDGVDHLWNEYLIQITAVVHHAYLNLGDGPYPTNAALKHKLLEKRKKFKLSFLTGGSADQNNTVGIAPAFSEVGATRPFIFDGPVPGDIGQFDLVPDKIQASSHGEERETEVVIESPPPGYAIDAHGGPDPIFCHVTEFLGVNGFVITWAVRTWLVECPIDNALRNKSSIDAGRELRVGPIGAARYSPLVDNRFDQIHDTDLNQLTTVTTYGTAVFRTDLLNLLSLAPDAFRGAILAPMYKGFRRAHIQVKQMSDTTVRYLTVDQQTAAVFEPSVQNAIRAEVTHQRVIAQKDSLESGIIKGMDRYYDFRQRKYFAEQDEKERVQAQKDEKRAAEAHKASLAESKANTRMARARAAYYNRKGGGRP